MSFYERLDELLALQKNTLAAALLIILQKTFDRESEIEQSLMYAKYRKRCIISGAFFERK